MTPIRESTTNDGRPCPLGQGARLLVVYRTLFQLLAGFGWLSISRVVRSREGQALALARWQSRAARRVRSAIFTVQGLFVKVGQLISVLASVLPAEFRRELEALQDQIPPRPLSDIEARLRQEFGRGATELFASFAVQPLASASLAQVHAATLLDGRRAAVKVQHPEIETLARRDLATLRNLLWIVRWTLGVRGLDRVFDEVSQMIGDELDFAREAENTKRIAANFATDPMVRFPEVVAERSTARVLTTTLMEGIKVSERETLVAQGIDPGAVAERMIRAYCQMIFVDGLYHADPHPGNLLVQPDAGLVFLDFGAVAQLMPGIRQGLPKLIEGILRRDREAILRAARQLGFVAKSPDDDTAERLIDYFYRRFFDQIDLESWNLKDLRVDPAMKVEIMKDLSRLDISVADLTEAFEVPKEWILLQRTLVLLAGGAAALEPRLQPMAVVRPYLVQFVLGHDEDWSQLAAKFFKDLALAAIALPDDLSSVLRKARRGEIAISVRGLEESAGLLYAASHQLLLGIAAMVSGTLAYQDLREGSPLLWLPASTTVLTLLLLGLSLLRGRRLHRAMRRRA